MSNDRLLASTIAASCPISARRVDSNLVRIISFEVMTIALALAFTESLLIAGILFYDFLVRALRYPKFSVLYIVAEFILSSLGIAPKLCDESPKRFALFLGLSITVVLLFLYALEVSVVAWVLICILILCTLLETVFDFCIGCKIYYLLQLIKGAYDARHYK